VSDASVLWQGPQGGAGALLRGCILGTGCRIGPLAVLAAGVSLGDNVRLSGNGRLLSP